MTLPQSGDTVYVHFTARLDDGIVIEESEDGAPFEAVLGAGTINPAFDEALRTLTEGESTTITLPPEKAYGKYNTRLVFKLKRKRLDLKGNIQEGSLVRVTLLRGRKPMYPYSQSMKRRSLSMQTTPTQVRRSTIPHLRTDRASQ